MRLLYLYRKQLTITYSIFNTHPAYDLKLSSISPKPIIMIRNFFGIAVALVSTLLLLNSCEQETIISPGNDPNFTIVAHTDNGFSKFNRKVEVFSIPIYAVEAVTDERLLHAANIMAQYLDNDEDGAIDNQAVHDAMIANNAYMVMWKKQSDLNKVNPSGNAIGQDLGNDETIPEWHANGHTGQFDAAIEEVFHIITHAGYEQAYPTIFGTNKGTAMSNAMDVARGGAFDSPPNNYPAGAWYTYNDQTCDYQCQAGEYIYWVMTSMLGAQENRQQEIADEWDLYTRALVESTDPTAFALLSDPQYIFPTILPDGTYKR